MATDSNQSAQQSDKVSRQAAAETMQTGHSVWQEAYDLTHANGSIVAAADSATKQIAKLAKPCSPSPTYLTLIDKALSQSYAPEAFGDPKKVRHEFDCKIHNEDDAFRFASLVLKRGGDGHTEILAPSENLAMQAQSDPSFVGLGIKTTFDPGNSKPGHDQGLAVLRTYPDSPATRAGLKIGDKIISVDTQDLTKLSYGEADTKIQGLADSVAHLLVERNGKELPIDIVRKVYSEPAVTDASLPNGLAYICIDNFRNVHLADQLRDALLKHKNARGYVIDVRTNGGGDVDLANQALTEVMNDGEIMKTRERDVQDTDQISYLTSTYELTPKGVIYTQKPEDNENTFKIGNSGSVVTFDNDPQPTIKNAGRRKNLVGDKPVDILINGLTASAAEIFTGAERDTGKARLVGTASFGKGIGGLYSAKELPHDAGEIVTNMRWFTPSNYWVGDAEKHKYGLKPDVEVPNPYGAIPLTADDVQLAAAVDDVSETLRKRGK